MALIDPRGKLLGKINIIDATVLLAFVLAILGFVFLRSNQATVAQVSQSTQPVEVDMLIRSLSIGDPDVLAPGKTTQVIIRNQPSGSLTIKHVKQLPHLIPLAMADGTVRNVPEPGDPYARDYVVTLGGEASVSADGPVIGRTKTKIGTPIEIEGFKYILRGGIVDVRLSDNQAQEARDTNER